MDKKIIEKKGINAVSDYICDCGYLEDQLTCNDKTLLWDGDIFVYSNKDKLIIDNYRYSVKTQVKATEWKAEKFPQQQNYEIKLRDLKKYDEDGGVVFFIVVVKRNRTSKVFYRVLSKIQIKHLINSASGKKFTKVQCLPVPEPIVFLREIESLHNQANHTIITPNELIGKEYKMHIHTPYAPKDLNFLSHLATSYNDVLVSIDGIPGEFYLMAPTRLQLGKIFSHSIKVNDKEYFNQVKVEFILEGIKCSIGNSVNILFPHKLKNIKPQEVTVSYKFSASTILEAELELSFIIDVFKNGGFFIDNFRIPLGNFTEATIKQQIDAWSDMLLFVKRIKELFKILGVIEDIDFNKLTNAEAKGFEILMAAFLDEAFIDIDPHYDKKESYVENFTIAGITLFIFLELQEDGSYKFKDIHNYFDFPFRSQKGKLLQRPTLSILLERDDLPANLGLENAFRQYRNLLEEDESSFFIINHDLERLLTHYDRTNKFQYLRIAFELFQILFDFEGGNTELNIYTRIIGLEIYKRQEKVLKDTHKELLYDMENHTSDPYLKFAIAVLTDNFDKSDWILKNMDSEMRKFTMERPLYTYYEKIKHK